VASSCKYGNTALDSCILLLQKNRGGHILETKVLNIRDYTHRAKLQYHWHVKNICAFCSFEFSVLKKGANWRTSQQLLCLEYVSCI
jgi:hypothetical protein